MKLPKGIKTNIGNGDTHMLQIINNLYGWNQSGQLKNKCLKYKLPVIVFKKSAIDECIFYRGLTIFSC